MTDGLELCWGYLDVKAPTRVRKRGFTPWKAWKRHWCVLHKSPSLDGGLEIQLGSNRSNVVLIPRGSILCRTQSRSRQFSFGIFPECGKLRRPLLFLSGGSETDSQKWMKRIRDLLHPRVYGVSGHCEFQVSLIDNDHSRAAGLVGLFGTLSVEAECVVVTDQNSGAVLVHWDWSELNQFHLAAASKPEDEKQICVMHTSSEFCAGQGQLLLFCSSAPELLQILLTKGRLQRLLTSPLPSPPLLSQRGRRLSRSESDLYFSWGADSGSTSSSSHSGFLRPHCRSRDSGVRVSSSSDDSGPIHRGKVASSLISAGLGLMFSTPGCSEADNESLHECQHVGVCDSDDELEMVGGLFRMDMTNKSWNSRRESGVSVASGIYEEIPDVIMPNKEFNQTENPYENLTFRDWRGHALEPSPPPLPPRIHPHFRTMESMSDEGIGDGDGLTLPSPLMLRLQRGRCYSDSSSSRSSGYGYTLPAVMPCQPEPTYLAMSTSRIESEPDYLPMSPIIRKVTKTSKEEPIYMVMASINST